MNDKLRIVGHGLAGCVLAMTCYRKEVPFRLVGFALDGEASMASSGLIAPITGRRYVKAWRIDEFIEKSLDFYTWSESLLEEQYFFPIEIVRFLSHPESQKAWHKRLDDPEYAAYISDKKSAELESLGRPYGILTGGYRLDTPGWIGAVRNFLKEKGLLEEIVAPYEFQETEKTKTIFATGAIMELPGISIIPNKGEALIVRMPDWKINEIIKEEVFIVPLKRKDEYWIGSYYMPWPDHPHPTPEGKEQLLRSLLKVYHGTLDILHHLAGVRPTVNDRRPLIGPIPERHNQYVFNGMGTKGTSLAPFWADQLVAHIVEDIILSEEVDPGRYIPRHDFGKPSAT